MPSTPVDRHLAPRAILRSWLPDVRAAAPGWILGRAIFVSALVLCRFLVDSLSITDVAIRAQLRNSLFAWDAGWYRKIALIGYGPSGRQSLRFFPLMPLASRALGTLLGGRSDLALVLIANASALALGAALHRLVLLETGDRRAARRAAWLVALAPPAFVLVLGYSEATFMLLAVVAFSALRTNRWWWAAAAGLLAGLTRPLGVLLSLAAAVEVWRAFRAWRATPHGHRRRWPPAGWLAALAGPAVGTGIYLWWVDAVYGDAVLPLRIQQDSIHRGHFLDPFSALRHAGRGLAHGQHVGSALHVVWAIGLLVLLVVCFRRWPASYGAFAAAMLLVALSSQNLDSLERYGLSAFPCILAATSLTESGLTERIALTLSAAALQGYTVLTLLNAYVP